MRRFWPCIGLFLITFFPGVSWGEDSTLLLTFKTELKSAVLKNELRAGLWKNGKDGLDPLDTVAMLNGQFDAYFEIPSSNGGPSHTLWWDIRSFGIQEWKLHLKSPPSHQVTMQWRQIPYAPGTETVLYSIVDTATGRETRLENGIGILTWTSSGTQTFIIKSRTQ